MNNLIKKQHTLIGGDKTKDQFTMRGYLDSLETVLNDMVTELKYHQQQVAIISAEKDTSGALLQMNIVQARNAVLNEEYKCRQEQTRQDGTQRRFFDKIQRQIEAVAVEHHTENARILALQRRIWDTEVVVGIPTQPWGNKAHPLDNLK